MKTSSDYYDMFVADSVDYAEIAAMDLAHMASQIAELIGHPQAEGDYPRDEMDGTIDIYCIAAMVQTYAAQCDQDAEAARWEARTEVENR